MLFWSVISAAFIGPGTVATAAKAGAGFGTALLWALFFSVLATLILQEAAARITIASGKSLGAVLNQKFQSKSGALLRKLLFFAVAFGCAAYQTGNLLGALSGIELITNTPPWILLLLIGAIASGLLLTGNIQWIARSLGVLVALMGILFVAIAAQSEIPFSQFAGALVKPTFPEGSTLLITALIGTTIVPYNLFLASGISQGQSIGEMRVGLSLAIIIGGVISMAILITGTALDEAFTFEALQGRLSQNFGEAAGSFFALGLFAAGLSSAITAPLAAAVTGASLFKWDPKGKNFRTTWIIILGLGLMFSLLKFKPIPAIIMAQAINGVLLPLVAIFLYIAVNDKSIMGKALANKPLVNLLFLLITGLTAWLGLHNIIRIFNMDANGMAANIIKSAGTIACWVGLILSNRKTHE